MLFIDEAGLIGTKTMRSLLELAERSTARVVLVSEGNHAAHAGADGQHRWFRTLQRTKTGCEPVRGIDPSPSSVDQGECASGQLWWSNASRGKSSVVLCCASHCSVIF